MQTSVPGRKSYRLYLVAVLSVAVFLRLVIFSFPALEHDERLYRALVDQVEAGRPFSLRGHPILEANWIDKRIYDSPVFFHPPVGIYAFWLARKFGGSPEATDKLAQLACFLLFFGSLLLAARELGLLAAPAARYSLPWLVALTPIYAHTNMKVWIDNPRVALLALLTALVIRFGKGGGGAWAGVVALVSLLVVFTKVDGLLALPFTFALGIAVAPPAARVRRAWFFLAVFAMDAAGAAWWLWFSQALHYGPGRPTAELIEASSFIRFVTVTITTPEFVGAYLKTMAALVPAALVVGVRAWSDARLGRRPLRQLDPRWALLLGILLQVAFYAFLASRGYSKMLRYLVMTVPAACLLFGYAGGDLQALWRAHGRKPGPFRAVLVAASLLLAMGFALECYQGVNFLRNRPRDAYILPIF